MHNMHPSFRRVTTVKTVHIMHKTLQYFMEYGLMPINSITALDGIFTDVRVSNGAKDTDCPCSIIRVLETNRTITGRTAVFTLHIGKHNIACADKAASI